MPASIVLRSGVVSAAVALVACTQEPPPLASTGEQAFAVCLACHAPDSQNRPTGPNLHGLFGRPAGTREGYFFSEPLKASGIVWDAPTLEAFIANPSERVPGTFMLVGVPDPVRRAAIVEYLRGLE